MSDITLITGLASLMGCLCMALVCAAQMVELAAAARPAKHQAWDLDFGASPARQMFSSFEPACA